MKTIFQAPACFWRKADSSQFSLTVPEASVTLPSWVAALTMHARKPSIHQTKEALSKRTARQQAERTPFHYLQ